MPRWQQWGSFGRCGNCAYWSAAKWGYFTTGGAGCQNGYLMAFENLFKWSFKRGHSMQSRVTAFPPPMAIVPELFGELIADSSFRGVSDRPRSKSIDTPQDTPMRCRFSRSGSRTPDSYRWYVCWFKPSISANAFCEALPRVSRRRSQNIFIKHRFGVDSIHRFGVYFALSVLKGITNYNT